MFGACGGIAQTITYSFQFTASGLIGTLATATTPFEGKTFTNAAVTVSAVANAANVSSCGPQPCYAVSNDSATVSISGVGSFQITSTTGVNSVAVIDPVKGVTADEVFFGPNRTGASGDIVIGAGLTSTALVGSTVWSLVNSIGPIQTFINWGISPVSTNGGTLEFTTLNGSPGSNGIFQATYSGAPSSPTLIRTGVLSHIAAGGGWSTVITLVNNSSAAVSVTVALHDEDGSALSLPVTSTLQGLSQTNTTSSINGTINPKSTFLISMGDGIPATSVGWADVLSSGPLGGFAIFRQTPQSGSPSEGTAPLQSQSLTTLTLPFDDSAGFITGVALTNLSTVTANVTATVWDDAGNQTLIQNFTIAGSGHTSFALPTQIPITANKRGMVQFQSSGGLAGLGLRFSPFGTFTSVPAM
jgi:hypothetical protein